MNAIVKRLKNGQYLEGDDDTSIWVMTTGDLDRQGETVDPEGGDFSDFEANAVVVNNHVTDGPINDILGRVINHWNEEVGEGTRWPQVKGPARMALLGEVAWNTATQAGREAKDMAESGMLNGGSISFVPLDHPRKNREGGNHYRRWKLLEFSLCAVPSNPSAIRLKSLAIKRKANVYVTNPKGDVALFNFHSGNRRIDYMQDLSGARFVPPLDVQQRIAREIDAGKDEGEVGGFSYSTTGQKSFDDDDECDKGALLVYEPGTRVSVRQLGEGTVLESSFLGTTYKVQLDNGHVAEVRVDRLEPIELALDTDDDDEEEVDPEIVERLVAMDKRIGELVAESRAMRALADHWTGG